MEKHVPYIVDRHVPYPVKVPVKVPVAVEHHGHYDNYGPYYGSGHGHDSYTSFSGLGHEYSYHH